MALLLGVFFGGGRAAWAQSAQLDLRWPTPNPAWQNGEPIQAFLQHAGSENPLSGSYGSVRNGGTRFHEGIDLFPVRRDAHGEALDEVFAAMSGTVRHVNTDPQHSSYGRYVVLEHDEQSVGVYTLYAHLASVDAVLLGAGAQSGSTGEHPVRVVAGQVLGRMGRSAGGGQGASAGGYAIPKARAHLHFEMGLRLTDDFEWWYEARGFDDPNYHGAFNGMNLMGFDPLGFYEAHRAGRVRTMAEWFAQMQPAVRIHKASTATPDFVRRYPRLVKQGEIALGSHAGWRIECDPSGIPFRWTPLSADDVRGLRLGEPRIVAVDESLIAEQPAKQLVVKTPGGWRLGRDLHPVLQLPFGPNGQ